MGMGTNLCGDGWGWNGSSAGMGGMDIKSAGMGVISVSVQASSSSGSLACRNSAHTTSRARSELPKIRAYFWMRAGNAADRLHVASLALRGRPTRSRRSTHFNKMAFHFSVEGRSPGSCAFSYARLIFFSWLWPWPNDLDIDIKRYISYQTWKFLHQSVHELQSGQDKQTHKHNTQTRPNSLPRSICEWW